MKFPIKTCLPILGAGAWLLLVSACTDPAEGGINNRVPVFGTYRAVNVGSNSFDLQWPVLEDETGQRVIFNSVASIGKPVALAGMQPSFEVPVNELVAQWDFFLGLGYSISRLSSDVQYWEVSGVYDGGGLNTVLQEFTSPGPTGSIELRRIGNLLPDTWYVVIIETRLLYDHWGYIARPVRFLVKTLP